MRTLSPSRPSGARSRWCVIGSCLLALAMPALARADFAATVSGNAGNGNGFFGTAVQDVLANGGSGFALAFDAANSGSAIVEPFSNTRLAASSSSASANLSTGELKAFTTSHGIQTVGSGYAVNSASANASMRDVVRVEGDIAPGSFLAFTIRYHGVLSVDRTPSQLGDLSVSTSGLLAFSAFAVNGAGSTRSLQHRLVDGSCAPFGAGCTSGSSIDQLFKVLVPISNSARQVFFDFNLAATSLGNATADFGNTAGLALELPAGLGFGSDSGVLLSTPSAVPLPATLSLMLFGLAGLGSRLVRRTRH